MHELLLFGQVPRSRYTQVLNVLAGISAMQPQPVLEKHVVFKPNRKPGSSAQKQVGGAQDIQKAGSVMQAALAMDLFYLQLVADVEEKKAEEKQGGGGEGVREDVVMGEFGGLEFDAAEVRWTM